jgi:hypothetical protein
MDDKDLTEEDLKSRAADMVLAVDEARGEAGLHEAVLRAIDRFVHDETHPILASFSEVILLARRQALLQEQLDRDREALHHGHLSHEENITTGHHYEMLRREACEYNHLLRDIIESSGPLFTRQDLIDWLSAASQGRRKWATGEVVGAVSEIALHAALQGLPELRGLRYATLDEDLAGYDFVAVWQGQMVTVDAKTGFYAPLAEHKHGHRHLEISVPHGAVQDFRVTRHGLDLLRHEVRQALHREVDIEVHAPHSYYRANAA